jgi:hypothetical protein
LLRVDVRYWLNEILMGGLQEKPKKFGTMEKDKVVNVEKEEGEEQGDSSSCSSTWSEARAAPSDTPEARRAQPAEDGMQESGAQGEEVRYNLNYKLK